MARITLALDVVTEDQPFLLVREDYGTVYRILDRHDQAYRKGPASPNTMGKSRRAAALITGHPGTGKSTFLIWVLLHRLQQELPTAVQFNQDEYFIFDADGAVRRRISDTTNTDKMRLRRCWALVDNNQALQQPCMPFSAQAGFVIQASCGNSAKWKEWMKQPDTLFVVMELPGLLEIGAIVRENDLDVSRVFSLVNKWGPSTRVILSLMTAESIDAAEARLELVAFWSNPAIVPSLKDSPEGPSSVASTIVYFRPYREHAATGASRGRSFIPTQHLNEIFEGPRHAMSNEDLLKLFTFFLALMHSRRVALAGRMR